MWLWQSGLCSTGESALSHGRLWGLQALRAPSNMSLLRPTNTVRKQKQISLIGCAFKPTSFGTGGLQRKAPSLCKQHQDSGRAVDEGTPKFMGMPIYSGVSKPSTETTSDPSPVPSRSKDSAADYGRLRRRSRSNSQVRGSTKSSLNLIRL